MHPRSLIPMLAVVASCSSSATPPRDTRAADAAAIEAAMKDYTAAILANDAAKVASWWTEDALYIDRAAPAVHGRAGLDSLVKGELGAMSVTAASVEKDDLAVSGDLAYFIGRYHEVLQPRQGAAVEDG
jgi:ketosteroid isomerase-like protein